MPWDEFVGMLTECQARGFGESRIRARAGRRARISDSRGAGGKRSVSVWGASADILPLRRGGRADGVPGRVRPDAVSVSFCRDGKCGGRESNRGGMSGKLPENAVPEGFGTLSNGRFSSLRQENSVFAERSFFLSAKNFVFVRMAFCIFLECELQICGFWRIFMRYGCIGGAFFLILRCGKTPLTCHFVSPWRRAEVCSGTVRNEIKMVLNL